MNVILALGFVAQSVVLITSGIQGGAKSGTGFAVSQTATTTRILTAAHVVDGATAPLVFVGGPHGQRFKATILRVDPIRDIALLEIQYHGLAPVALSDRTPVAGTAVQVSGYPTLAERPGAGPTASPSPLPLVLLALTTTVGKTDGEAEEGESLLLDIPLTHGDSGAPVVTASDQHVVGMVLGLAGGYGVERWMTGDGLGLSVDAIAAFLAQTSAPSPPPKPSGVAAVTDKTDSAELTSSMPQFATSAGFGMVESNHGDPCVNAAGRPIANVVVEETSDASVLTLDVTDCSGEQFYHDTWRNSPTEPLNVIRLIDRSFLGYIDTHRAEWSTLLAYGVAVDPAKNPYLGLMSVERNPFGQLTVAHVFHGGPADVAGLRAGDAILKIDGRPTRTLAGPFIARLLDQPAVTLTASRDEREFTVRLKLLRFSELTAHGPIPR